MGSAGLPPRLGQPGDIERVFEVRAPESETVPCNDGVAPSYLHCGPFLPKRVLTNSAHGWDHIIPGLMRLGFYLLDGHKEG